MTPCGGHSHLSAFTEAYKTKTDKQLSCSRETEVQGEAVLAKSGRRHRGLSSTTLTLDVIGPKAIDFSEMT